MNFRDFVESVQIVGMSSDDLGDKRTASYRNQAWDLAQSSSIRILSDKDLSMVAVDGWRVLGAIFTGFSNDIYSFDIVADPKAGQIMSLKLIKAGLDEFNAYSDVRGAKMRLKVTNQRLIPILKSRFGMRVIKYLPDGDALMTRRR